MAVRPNHTDMGAYEWQKWLRQAGFEADHPDPAADLGYAGRDLDTGELREADTPDYDHWFQDPVEPDAYLLAPDALVYDAAECR